MFIPSKFLETYANFRTYFCNLILLISLILFNLRFDEQVGYY